MDQLEGFQYIIELDPKIWYHTIVLLPESCDLTTIVSESGKLIYNKVPMGLWYSGEIFQAKVYEFLSDIEGFKTYIDDIIVIGEGISLNIYTS